MDVETRGSGDANLLAAVARTARATTSASGNISVAVTDELSATVNGSGDIRYRGNPADLTTTDNGSGDISRID